MEASISAEMKRSAIIKGIKNGNLPQYIYKYMDEDTIKKVIKSNALKFNISSNFNDPFDSKAFIRYNFPYELIVSFFDLSSLPEKERNIAVSRKVLDIDEMRKMSNAIYSEFDNSMAISCFSEADDIDLMWSHYANGHRGVCLKFDIMKDLDFFSILAKVQYKDELTFYCFSEVEDNLFQQYTTKAKSWNYEREIRILKTNTQPGLMKFRKESLIEVSFGCRCSKENVESIKELLKQYNFENVEFRLASMANDFKLDFVSV
ncbi:DUF2971 domain-containing protein [Bacteroides fragilis]|uniref:DUF2971 domain-containing protein n=1 Tax=Bacteroides fragilis TaxID=817 RepID=UPI00082844DF|nr:DUF2971 domain-containing protein [Bacteroides fragilis]OCR41995.1 hypothetical protein AC239_17800 [Bacteroides fragilis]